MMIEFKKENKNMGKAEQRLEALKAAGIDVTSYMIVKGCTGEGFLFKTENGVPVPVSLDEEIVSEIQDGGYVFNRYTSPRWITAQMFHMLNSPKGYDKELKSKGISYEMKFLKDEIHRLAGKERDNDPTFNNRKRFFSIDVIWVTVLDYIGELEDYIESLDEHKEKSTGKIYVKVPGLGKIYKENLEVPVFKELRKLEKKMEKCTSYRELETVYGQFYNRMIHFDAPISKAFVDVYKGMGAYYTCDNLIKYNKCRVKGCKSEAESLKVLEDKTDEYDGCYWKLFGFMKQLIKDNNFEINW